MPSYSLDWYILTLQLRFAVHSCDLPPVHMDSSPESSRGLSQQHRLRSLLEERAGQEQRDRGGKQGGNCPGASCTSAPTTVGYFSSWHLKGGRKTGTECI